MMSGFFNGSAITDGTYSVFAEMAEGTSVARLFVQGKSVGSTNNLGDNHVAQGSDIFINITYQTG